MKIKELRELTNEQLEAKLTELRDKAFKQRLQLSLGQAGDTNNYGKTRKDIARVLTLLNEKKRS